MRKQNQLYENTLCLEEWEQVKHELMHSTLYRTKKSKRLRTCSAWVYETEHYYVLKSYATCIAFINKETDTLYDILRYVYGYTSTSVQHIAKFNHDYCKGNWGCSQFIRYYTV